jgi:c-di-GMP-binding flagellar brake protein YcgR
MLLIIQLIIVSILFLVLGTLYIDEYKTRYQRVPVGKMTGYWHGEERRKDIRIPKTLSVRYSLEKKPHLTVRSVTMNISRGGILLETSEKLITETLLGLEILIPNYQKGISADGKIMWVKECSDQDESGRRMFNAGIKFVSMHPKEKELLNQYITDNTPA